MDVCVYVVSATFKIGSKVDVKVLEFERVTHFQGDSKSTSVHRAMIEFLGTHALPLTTPALPPTDTTTTTTTTTTTAAPTL